MLNKLKTRFLAFHSDQQGAGMIEYILIIAAVALPLLGLIVFFKDDIVEWIEDAYEQATGRTP